MRRLVSGRVRCLRSPNPELVLDRSIFLTCPEGDNVQKRKINLALPPFPLGTCRSAEAVVIRSGRPDVHREKAPTDRHDSPVYGVLLRTVKDFWLRLVFPC